MRYLYYWTYRLLVLTTYILAKKDDKSKTEAMFIPGAGKKEDATAIDEEADIMIGEQEFFSYTKKFKYLGSIFISLLKDDDDII